MEALDLHFPSRCSTCVEPLSGRDDVVVPETAMPAMREVGDASHMVGYHRACAPQWAVTWYDRE